MPAQLSLVTLKAQPPVVPPGLVRRRRIEEQLTRGSTGSFTLVSAGPGAGKTLAVASWVAAGAAPRAVAWLSLDLSDNDPRTFWTDVLGALTSTDAVPAGSALRDIIPAAGFGPDEALEVRARLAELPSPVVLVLDDFHEITNVAVLDAFGQLVDHQPPQLRLVVLSRSDPVLRLHRLRVSGQLTEIRNADLAFTQTETAELFDLEGIALLPEQVGVLRSRTQGWSAGLRLAAMSLDPADVASGIDRFSGNDQSIADYLVGEVIEALPVDDREFLLTTSIVEQLTGDLANELTGREDSQLVLEKLVGANAFVLGIGQNEWFSYHPLLRELLRHRLTLERPRSVPELHRRASDWMVAHGEPIEAIRQSISGGDLDGAGRILMSIIPKILSAEGPILAAALEPLARSAAEHPTLSALMASATCNLHRLEMTAMLRDALEAREFLDDADDAVRPSASVAISLFQLAAARSRGDSAAVLALSRHTSGLLDAFSRRIIPAGRHYRVIAEINLGGAQVWTGDLGAADQQLSTSAPEALALGLPLVHLNGLGHRAVVEALQGRCRRAQRHAIEATQIIDRRGWASEPQALAAFLTLGLVALARHHLPEAAGHITRGLTSSGKQTDRAIRLALGIATTQLAVGRGDAEAALAADARLRAGLVRTPDAAELLVRWGAVAGAQALLLAGRPADAAERLGNASTGRGFAASWEQATLARARIATGQLREAQELIEPLLEPAHPFLEPAIDARLVQAIIAEHDHRETAAMAALSAAVDLAQPEGIRRPFLHFETRLVTLLQRYQRLGGKHPAFVAEIAEQVSASAPAPDADAVMVEHLTERELVVLHYLPTMLKAGEIASDLFVSVNTVKAHLRSMYRKLGVSNRREAVERARALGLL